MKFLMIHIRTKDGVVQRRIVNLDRICSIAEVDSDTGPLTLIKFSHDIVYDSDERPIYCIDPFDKVMKVLGDMVACVSHVQPVRRLRRKK